MATIASLLNHHELSSERVGRYFRQVSFPRRSSELVCVGKLDVGRINSLLHMNFREGRVYIHDGIIDHIISHHSGIYDIYRDGLDKLVEFPCMVGKNPLESDSIELYDESTHILMGIKKDRHRGYLFCASMYILDDWDRKIRERLASGRIRRYMKG